MSHISIIGPMVAPMSKREEKEYDRAQAEEDEPEDPEILE